MRNCSIAHPLFVQEGDEIVHARDFEAVEEERAVSPVMHLGDVDRAVERVAVIEQLDSPGPLIVCPTLRLQ